ncbi:Dual specificity phosphatase domain protein [Arachis hypogaea]|nr:Dual specificity phosphatase domain protein [Arachis hypogaea]
MNSRIRRDALERIIGEGDRNCIWELRMKTNAFANLCELLQVQVSLLEQVATFLIILAHHKENRSLQVRFCRSGETVSKYFNKVLKAIIRMQNLLFAKASPVEEDCIDPTWRKFKDCLGALDGTYIEVTVPESDKSRYRTRKVDGRDQYLIQEYFEMQSLMVIVSRYLMNMDMDPEEQTSFLDEFLPVGEEAPDELIDVMTMDKRMWTDEETEAFVGFMEQCVVDGLKADCGQFRPGTFEKLALKMLEAFPTCTCVDVDSRDVLDAWMKAHPTKFYTPGKPFPLFHRLEGIFGKDRATGAGAVSGFDVQEQVQEEEKDHCPSLDDFGMSANVSFHERQGAGSHSDACAASGRHSGKKRKQNDILERMVNQVQFSTAEQGRNAQVLADAISEVNEKFMVGEKLEQLGFDNDEVVQVAVKFANNAQMEKVFWDLKDSQKSGYMRSILN